MATKSRLLGRDVQIRIAKNAIPLATITAIKSFTFETRQRILTEGYLGETAQRQDSVFDEVGGSFIVHPEDPEVLAFQKFLVDRAIARTFDEQQVTITFRVSFPNRKIAKIVIPQPEFDPVPFTNSGRDAYSEMSFSWKSDRYSLLT